MSMLDSYKRNVLQKQSDLGRLTQEKATTQGKIADLNAKINSATQAISRTTSQSTIKSKQSDIQRYNNELTSLYKKMADVETKIVRKEKEIFDEQKKVTSEEEREQRKRVAQNQKQAREHEARMTRINQTLSRHTSMHENTKQRLRELQQSLPEKITVLFLAANPIDQSNLRLDEEARSINEMITKARHRDSVQFQTQWAVRAGDVLQAMNECQPTIVHFSGHGSDNDEIIFQDSVGKAKAVSKEAIVQTMMVASDNLRLVFFNTCYSYNQASDVTKHIEAAIGMNTSIGDEAARVFASQFYSAIGFGLSVGKAFNQAKAAVMLEGIPEENTPELFVQEGLHANEIFIVRPSQLSNNDFVRSIDFEIEEDF